MHYGFILLLSVFVCVKLGKCYSLHIVVLVICIKSILFLVNVGSQSCMTVSETGQKVFSRFGANSSIWFFVKVILLSLYFAKI
jgi:hypothetical protein